MRILPIPDSIQLAAIRIKIDKTGDRANTTNFICDFDPESSTIYLSSGTAQGYDVASPYLFNAFLRSVFGAIRQFSFYDDSVNETVRNVVSQLYGEFLQSVEQENGKPVAFRSFGQRVTVVYDNKEMDAHEAWGRCNRDRYKIFLKDRDNFNRNEKSLPELQRIFHHELAHWLFGWAGSENNSNECFINTYGTYLHQVTAQLVPDWV